MNRDTIAKAVATGVELALSQSYAEAEHRLNANASIDRCYLDGNARLSIQAQPTQLFHEPEGRSVEFRVSATDGVVEEVVFVYVREQLGAASWGVASAEVEKELEDLAITKS